MKQITMKKSLFDDVEANTFEEGMNPLSKKLTEVFFNEAHPFGDAIRKKVDEEDLANCRIRLLPNNYDPFGNTIRIHGLWVEVETRMDCTETKHIQMQSLYINGQLATFLNEQHFNVPTEDVDETERFLKYLEQYVPDIWDYFKVEDDH